MKKAIAIALTIGEALQEDSGLWKRKAANINPLPSKEGAQWEARGQGAQITLFRGSLPDPRQNVEGLKVAQQAT